MKRTLAEATHWMDTNGMRVTPWLLIANLLLLLYLISVAQDARDGAWEAESSASEAARENYGDQLDALRSTLESVETDVRRVRADVSSINTTLMFRR